MIDTPPVCYPGYFEMDPALHLVDCRCEIVVTDYCLLVKHHVMTVGSSVTIVVSRSLYPHPFWLYLCFDQSYWHLV